MDSSVATLYYSSSPVAVFAVEQQLQSSDATAVEADSSTGQYQTSPTNCHNLDAAKSANTDTGNQTAVESSVSEVCDIGFSVSDKSVAIAPQTLDYLHKSCSASESNTPVSYTHLTLPTNREV